MIYSNGHELLTWSDSNHPSCRVLHHDGFVIYQSRYTDHGIMSSPFMNGNGSPVTMRTIPKQVEGRPFADCEFDNIINDPSRRLISLAEPVTARYLRMDVQQLSGTVTVFRA